MWSLESLDVLKNDFEMWKLKGQFVLFDTKMYLKYTVNSGLIVGLLETAAK